jgi:hypothetical protein
MMKLLSAIVAAFFAIAAVTPAFAEEKKDEKSMEKKDTKSADKKKAEEKKSESK